MARARAGRPAKACTLDCSSSAATTTHLSLAAQPLPPYLSPLPLLPARLYHIYYYPTSPPSRPEWPSSRASAKAGSPARRTMTAALRANPTSSSQPMHQQQRQRLRLLQRQSVSRRRTATSRVRQRLSDLARSRLARANSSRPAVPRGGRCPRPQKGLAQ